MSTTSQGGSSSDLEWVHQKAMLLELEYIKLKEQESLSTTNFNLSGEKSVFLSPDGKRRVRLKINRKAKASLKAYQGRVVVSTEEGHFLDFLNIEKIVFHCPNQVSICHYYSCTNGCLFCPLPSSTPRKSPTIEAILSLLRNHLTDPKFSFSITHGLPKGKRKEDVFNEICNIIERIKSEFGNSIPIGIGPYPCSEEWIKRFKNAGADEIRINLETYNQDLFSVICPNEKYSLLVESLKCAVRYFGKNKVSSSMILGVGESTDDVLDGLNFLTGKGIIPTLHPLETAPRIINVLKKKTKRNVGRPKASKLLDLAKEHKRFLEKRRLNPTLLKCSCPACTADGLMPFVDF